jgi:hypothetical protein
MEDVTGGAVVCCSTSGDHLQLPPTVLSEAAAKAGLSCTLFERLQQSLGDAASCMLTVQYRMHSQIMDWSSQELYEVGHRTAQGRHAAALPVLRCSVYPAACTGTGTGTVQLWDCHRHDCVVATHLQGAHLKAVAACSFESHG